MPLVSSSIIAQWYRTDSWVYRHFTYLWRNQLWQRPVPKGFSLCPYFWSALFSIFIFRPFVVTLLIARMCVRVLCLNRLIRWTDRQVLKVMKSDGSIPFGMPTASAIALTILLSMLLSCLFKGGAIFYEASHLVYLEYAGVGALPFLGLPLALTAILIACGIYSTNVRHSECQPEVYVRVAAVAAVLVALFIDAPAMLWVVKGVSLAVWDGPITFFGVYIWEVVSSIGMHVWSVVKWTGLWMAGAAVASLAVWPVALAVLAVLGFAAKIALRFDTPVEPKEPADESAPKTLSPSKMRSIGLTQVSRSVWLRFGDKSADLAKAFARRSPVVSAWLDKIIDPTWASLDTGDLGYNITQHKEFDGIVKAVADEFSKTITARNAKKQARVKRCVAVTGAIGNVINPVGRAIAWPFKNGAILVVYMWQVAKGRKQGVCPYMTFSSPETKPAVKSTSK